MARIDTFDDSHWDEVMSINGYAVFMGYLMMGVRGLGVLIITWTTVVLLGGFVSVLGKKDFWCLTGITLVQTAGVFNFILKETLSDLGYSWLGLVVAVFATFKLFEPFGTGKLKISVPRMVLAFHLLGIQVLVFVIILFPVAVLYMFGMYISAGLGFWRLIEHDFGNADESANLKPALEVLYSLAVAQGVLFGYRTIHGVGTKFGLAEFVAEQIGTRRPNKRLISDYLEGTVEGCEKDPTFATGRNLVTYGVDLMVGAKSNNGFIAGIRVLGIVIDDEMMGRKVLAKHLLASSTSFTHTIQRLLDILGPRSPYSSEIREHAARIVALVAGGIRLEQCPRGIQCISSLLDTFEEYSWVPEEYERDIRLPLEYERDWLLEKYERHYLLWAKRTDSTDDSTSRESSSPFLQDYERVPQGLFILQNLAVREENRKVISNTKGLLLKIKAPLMSNQLHREHHDVWSRIAEASMGLMIRLMATPGKTGRKLQRKITGNKKAFISTLESIVECGNCRVAMKRQAVQILLDPSVNQSFIIDSGSSLECKVPITWILIFLLLDDYFDQMCGSIHWKKKLSDIRRLAGEKLSDLFFPNIELSAMLLLQSGGSITSTLLSARIVVGDLTEALIVSGSISIRLQAAEILEHLCRRHYRKNDEYLKELKKAMVDVMPQVLKDVLGYGSTSKAVSAVVTEANNVQSSSQDIIDLESGGIPDGNAQENTSSSQQQQGEQAEEKKLREALLSLLCRIISYEWWYLKDTELAHQLDEIAEKVCSEQGKPVKNFRDLVSEAVKLLKS